MSTRPQASSIFSALRDEATSLLPVVAGLIAWLVHAICFLYNYSKFNIENRIRSQLSWFYIFYFLALFLFVAGLVITRNTRRAKHALLAFCAVGLAYATSEANNWVTYAGMAPTDQVAACGFSSLCFVVIILDTFFLIGYYGIDLSETETLIHAASSFKTYQVHHMHQGPQVKPTHGGASPAITVKTSSLSHSAIGSSPSTTQHAHGANNEKDLTVSIGPDSAAAPTPTAQHQSSPSLSRAYSLSEISSRAAARARPSTQPTPLIKPPLNIVTSARRNSNTASVATITPAALASVITATVPVIQKHIETPTIMTPVAVSINPPVSTPTPVTNSPNANSISRAKALYAYKANPDDPTELSFDKGEILTVIETKSKWWKAIKTLPDGSTMDGIVPSNYFQRL